MPVEVDWDLTSECNLRCTYCYATYNELIQQDPVDPIYIASRICQLKPSLVVLQGGEPLMCSSIAEILRVIKSHSIAVTIITNGTLLTEARLQSMLVWLDLEVDGFQITIDGPTAVTHNRTRPGSFEATIEGARRLVQHGIPTCVRMNVTEENASTIAETQELCTGLGLKWGFDAHPITAHGRAAHLPASRTSQYLCTAGRTHMHVCSNGDCYPCSLLVHPALVLGNICRTDPKAVWENGAWAASRIGGQYLMTQHKPCEDPRWNWS